MSKKKRQEEMIPAIPPEDYSGSVWTWMIALIERGLWDGDAIIYQGLERTVNAHNIKHDKFMGTSIFGDSYKLGYEPVQRVIYHRCKNG
ncbi:hypothetical protein [Anaerophaga thermohalophila]|jgi:hypothetical protein|uniref:hypothetical protein n=1 Tax=Anaerophaga thermohalophila TaxID=177400 RepID=UPI000237C821|nr:hypothetical protein [Anaerophaga thermohalophila]